MEIRRITSIKEGTDIVGNRTRVKVVKNKVAPPFKMTEFDIMYGEGISYEGDIIDLALKGEIIEKTGAWYSYGDTRIGQGRENAKKYLKDNANERDRMVKEVKAFLGVEEDNTD